VKICQICCMDETCKPIQFLGRNGCSYCSSARQRLAQDQKSKADILAVVERIRQHGTLRGRKYDCIVGVSGGLDSTFLLYRLVGLGLKPLAVHMDNNWNSSMASSNLKRALKVLGIDLITYVTPWSVQRGWQRALLDSDVADVELLYDNLLHEVCYREAKRHDLKFIIGGANNATEGVEVPKSWLWHTFDGKNLEAIARRRGVATREMPVFTYAKWLRYTFINRIRWVSLLDWMSDYSRDEAEAELARELNYKPYGSKHFENVFTRFYQAEILPRKFGFDKRKPHLSSEIVSGGISRSTALEKLQEPTYSTKALRELDMSYVLSKLGMTTSEFESYLERPGIPHSEYSQDLVGLILRAVLRYRDRMRTLK